MKHSAWALVVTVCSVLSIGAQQQQLQRPMALELGSERSRLHSKRTAGDLHQRSIRSCPPSHIQGNADDAIVAHQAHFGGGAIFHCIDQGHDGRGWEVKIALRLVRFIDDVATRKLDRLQLRDEPRIIGARELREEPVLDRRMRGFGSSHEVVGLFRLARWATGMIPAPRATPFHNANRATSCTPTMAREA